MSVLVIGQGAVGRALVTGLAARGVRVTGIPSRGLTDWAAQWHEPPSFWADTQAPDADTLLYAAGPAGEAACRRDPPGAFHAHYTAPLDWATWVTRARRRRLVLIGTVQTAGFYGALKQMAAEGVRNANRRGRILHLRCGQIIGPEMPVDGTGVVARWIRQMVAGQPLVVHPEAPPLVLTLCEALLDRITTWLARPDPAPWEEALCTLPAPIPLIQLAVACAATQAGRSPAIAEPDNVTIPGPLLTALTDMAANAQAHAVRLTR